MEGSQKKTLKYEYFRQAGQWADLARDVCTWVNCNINTCRLVGITAVLCSYDNTNMVNLYYNDGPISPDVLAQTSNAVLVYEIFTHDKN